MTAYRIIYICTIKQKYRCTKLGSLNFAHQFSLYMRNIYAGWLVTQIYIKLLYRTRHCAKKFISKHLKEQWKGYQKQMMGDDRQATSRIIGGMYQIQFSRVSEQASRNKVQYSKLLEQRTRSCRKVTGTIYTIIRYNWVATEKVTSVELCRWNCYDDTSYISPRRCK